MAQVADPIICTSTRDRVILCSTGRILLAHRGTEVDQPACWVHDQSTLQYACSVLRHIGQKFRRVNDDAA